MTSNRSISKELKLLEDLLKKNFGDEEERDEIDLVDNEVYHYFYFDQIADPSDLEAAWAVFPESTEVRKRLTQLDGDAKVISGFGYRIPKNESVSNEQLVEIVETHLKLIRPFLEKNGDCDEEVEFLSSAYKVVLAPPEVNTPDASKNSLFLAFYDAVQYALQNLPDYDYYSLLYNWAVYMTKCDEVALYLLWPCLQDCADLPPQSAESGFRLWQLDCRDRYWVKDNDFSSGVVYVRPPKQH